MQYRMLGDTGLRISSISLGTAELGMDYGFRGATNGARPDLKEGIRLIHKALDAGINCLDTAPSYGNSEIVIGEALKQTSVTPTIVSKVLLPNISDNGTTNSKEISSSIESSLQSLGIETLDILLIHNTSVNALKSEEVRTALQDAKQQGKVRFIGASCYADDLPAEVLSYPDFRVMQVPFNLLDQKMAAGFFQAALTNGIGVFARSIYLRGVLTPQVNRLPERLLPLKAAAFKALEIAGDEVRGLSELALRFSLSFSGVSSVLIGVKNVSELESNLADAERGVLSAELLTQLRTVDLGVSPMVDTRTWQDVII
ncbi:MAG TPA: aldo/keto reductase [Pyrinomonadaceae bacterium]|nr:aldo/keto reductase [Pyrinomonadaceae bacterium]